MIFGIGTDIIEIARVEKELAKDYGLKETLFTANEIKYCESKRNSIQHFAARYAAKEAFFKAIGIGWRNGLSYDHIEIINDEFGKPEVILHNKAKEFYEENGFSNIHVSLSHIKTIVNAIIIIEK